MSVWDSLSMTRATEGLARQMKSDEVAHSWLLLGPPGAGKRAAAMAMAAAVNCREEPGVGCGTCSTCQRIMRRRHPDVHHIVPEGPLIPVDQIRDMVIPEASRSPFEGRMKVFIIEEAERMNDAAQNSLLKTLEEPQPDTMFVLVSDREDELLETIQSRCRVVRLEPISHDGVVALLVARGISESDATVAALVSGGDPERAVQLVDDPAVGERRKLWRTIPSRLTGPVAALDVATEILDQSKLAMKEREQLQKVEVVELAEALGEGRGTATARNALATRHKREARRAEEEVLGEALEFLATFYRDVLAHRRGAGDDIVNADLTDSISQWAASDASDASDAALLLAAERCISARETLTRNANVPLAIESALLEVGRLVQPPRGLAASTAQTN
jgi:DNA polymerase III subunit delta'